MRWKLHPEAAEEYIEACRYYTKIERKLGAAFVRNVEDTIEKILLHPTAWRVVEGDMRRHLLKRFPYAIYYTIEGDSVLIVSVAHMKRRPGYWRGRLG